jgi:hypothetical protein
MMRFSRAFCSRTWRRLASSSFERPAAGAPAIEGLVRDPELLLGRLGDRHPLPRGLSISRSLAMICSIECFFVVTGYALLVLTFSLGLTEEMDQFLGAGHFALLSVR